MLNEHLVKDSDISEHKDFVHITNTTAVVSLVNYSDYSKQTLPSALTLQTSLLSI